MNPAGFPPPDPLRLPFRTDAVLAILRAKPDKADEFERLFTELAAQVREKETCNIAYRLCRTRSEPNTYKVLELYRDEAALEAHRGSDHFRAAGPGLGGVLEGRPEIELLDAVG